LSELSNCHKILSTYWSNIETLKELGGKVSNMECPYNFKDETRQKKYDYFRQNIPCDRRPECGDNGCIDSPGSSDPPKPRTCTEKDLCSNDEYISNLDDLNQPFICENLKVCGPGEEVIQDPESTNILDTSQYYEDRQCKLCISGTYSSADNSKKCHVLSNANNTQHMVYDKKYYTKNGNTYFTGDRLLTNVLYTSSYPPQPYDIKLNWGTMLVFTKNINKNYYEFIQNVTSMFLIHVTPDNKELFRELCKQHIHDFTTDTELNDFFDTHLKGTEYTSTFPIIKRDYYRWCIIKPSGEDRGIYIYQENITEKFFNKYDIDSPFTTQSEKNNEKINSDIINYFSSNNILHPHTTQVLHSHVGNTHTITNGPHSVFDTSSDPSSDIFELVRSDPST